MSIGEGVVSLVELIKQKQEGAGEVKLRPDILAEFIHKTADTNIPIELRRQTRGLAILLTNPRQSGHKYPQGLEMCAEINRIAQKLGIVPISKDIEDWATWVGTAQELLETYAKTERTLQ